MAVEKQLRIMVGGEEALTLYCTPTMVKELVVGFLMTEGIIDGGFCAERVSVTPGPVIVADVQTEGKLDMSGMAHTSGCVGGVTFHGRRNIAPLEDSFTIGVERLRELFNGFQAMSSLYKLTGCVHSSALASKDGIVAFAEDVGRHNAVDKIIGYAILEEMGFRDKVLLTSGRISSEITSKCARWGIPIVVSRTATTSLALELADVYGVTLVGFMRGARMNVYTRPDRLL